VAQVDIRRYARRSCRSASDAEKAAQEALIVLYRRIGTLREVGAISAWLLRIVNRFCLRLTLRLAGVRSAIQSLPEHYREVAVLRDLEELTTDEIAQRLDTTRETVKARLHRARALMREYLLDE